MCLCAEDQLEVEYTSPEKCVGQYSRKNVTSIITFSCDHNMDYVCSLETALPLFWNSDLPRLLWTVMCPSFTIFLQVQSKQSDCDCLDCVFNIVWSRFAKCIWLFCQGLSLLTVLCLSLWDHQQVLSDPSNPSCKDRNKCKKGVVLLLQTDGRFAQSEPSEFVFLRQISPCACFRHKASIVCWESWNLSEQICGVDPWKVWAWLVLLILSAIYSPVCL